jgi:hypothetical protein
MLPIAWFIRSREANKLSSVELARDCPNILNDNTIIATHNMKLRLIIINNEVSGASVAADLEI